MKKTVWEMPEERSCQLVMEIHKVSGTRSRSSSDHGVGTSIPNTKLNSTVGFTVY